MCFSGVTNRHRQTQTHTDTDTDADSHSHTQTQTQTHTHTQILAGVHASLVSSCINACLCLAVCGSYTSRLQESWFDKSLTAYDMVKAYERNISSDLNTGNKDVTSNGLERLLQFNKVRTPLRWCCCCCYACMCCGFVSLSLCFAYRSSRSRSRALAPLQWLFSIDEDTVVVNGHSLWFKSYFTEFLPRSVKVRLETAASGTRVCLFGCLVVWLFGWFVFLFWKWFVLFCFPPPIPFACFEVCF